MKYRTKPMEVEALQLTQAITLAKPTPPLTEGSASDGDVPPAVVGEGNGGYISGQPGDWLVTMPNDTQTIVANEVFLKEFEPVKATGGTAATRTAGATGAASKAAPKRRRRRKRKAAATKAAA